MSERATQSKVYLEIVEKIKEIIDEKQLGPEDKLPSERELADQLKVGRSSVREALRALELLGLIETRRGEGTFISDFRNHRLVEILSGFILQNSQAKKDVSETKHLIERSAIHLLIQQKRQLDPNPWHSKTEIDDREFFRWIIDGTENFLLLKIWRILSNFEKSLHVHQLNRGKESFIRLLTAINKGNLEEADRIYSSII